MAQKTFGPLARPDLAGSPRPKKPTQVRVRRLLVPALQCPCSPLLDMQDVTGPLHENTELRGVEDQQVRKRIDLATDTWVYGALLVSLACAWADRAPAALCLFFEVVQAVGMTTSSSELW